MSQSIIHKKLFGFDVKAQWKQAKWPRSKRAGHTDNIAAHRSRLSSIHHFHRWHSLPIRTQPSGTNHQCATNMDHTPAYATTLNSSIINPHNAFLWSCVSGVQEEQEWQCQQIKDDGGNWDEIDSCTEKYPFEMLKRSKKYNIFVFQLPVCLGVIVELGPMESAV